MDLLPIASQPNGVVVLTIDQPGRSVAVLDSELLDRLGASLDRVSELVRSEDIRGVVLTSNSRVFVAGANLAELNELPDEEAAQYLAKGRRVFEKISALAVPTVAAINGAALGGGLELALHCDHLIAQLPKPREDGSIKMYQVGLPEAGLGLCPGWGGTCTLASRVCPESELPHVLVAIAEGRTFKVDELHALGVIEELVGAEDDLIARASAVVIDAEPSGRREPKSIALNNQHDRIKAAMAQAKAKWPDTEAARAIAECIHRGLSSDYAEAVGLEQRHLVRLRNTDHAKERLEAFFAKS